ncbi:hypothetical protein IQ265_19885 [Nodosilinea sp. LEGE 06152]|uniref:hypothetical protein n=1 Tax=Nodosilinea sp. LEGE 06152 TaxID=2777966 RepID=UPI00188034FA|nr:hypothetical protein [Nodosilinea sp. LEGE 06152]MBE9159077.1 hypothetical protein [Nodosilinea sp. LEGE 06152]
MSTTYYPWNVQALVDWLKLELAERGSLQHLAAALQVPPQVLNGWFKGVTPTITLQQIRHIAQYRGWSVQQTLRWLKLRSTHIEELIAQDMLSDRVSWSEAKALWFGPPAA